MRTLRLQVITGLLLALPHPSPAQEHLVDRFFDSGGVRIRYIEAGVGDPVVLVHGNLSNADRQWVNSGVVSALARTHRVIALDCRGFGKSDKPHDPDQYGAEMARDVVRLLDHLGIARAHVVGYSMGGSIVAQLLTLAPERVITATLGGSSGSRRISPNAQQAAATRIAEYREGMLRSMLTSLSPADSPPTADEIRRWSSDRLAGLDREALVALTRNVRGFLIADSALARVQLPVLAIAGSRDPALTGVRELERIMPTLRVVVIEGATHTGETGATLRPEFADAVAGFINTRSHTRDSIPQSVRGDFGIGPHPVGFRLEYRYDHGRVERPELRLDGSVETRPIARLMQIGIWYPARPARRAARMRLAEYVELSDYVYFEDDPRVNGGVPSPLQREDIVRGVFRRAVFQGLDEARVPLVLQSRTAAVRDAPVAAGRYPLILVAPGSGGSLTEHAITAEYLASHGYVVVGAPSRGRDAAESRATDVRVAESQLRDLAYLIDYASRVEGVDTRRVGVVSHSWGSVAAVLLASENPSIDAIVSLDGSITGLNGLRALERSASFAAERVRVPVLIANAESRRTDSSFFQVLPHSTIYDLTVAGIHHLDFVDFAVYHTAVGANSAATRSPAAHVREAHAWIGRYTKLFFDAYVRNDRDSLDLLRNPDRLRAPDRIFALRRNDGRAAPPAAPHVYEMLWRPGGWRDAMRLLEEVRSQHPAWTPLTERVVTITAAQLRELGRTADALGVLQLGVAQYPNSGAAHAALGDAQLRAGNREAAIVSLMRALELDPNNAAAMAALRRAEGR